MIEIWKPVLGYEAHYEVSNLGNVRSLVRVTRQGRRGGGVLKPQRGPKGYLMVVLSAALLGKRKRLYVHHLVLEAFVGPRPPGMDACHDPDPTRSNCRLDNLRWDTRANNLADKAAHGTQTRGEAHPVAKITEADAREILRLRRTGKTCREIGLRFGISLSTVSLIGLGKLWAHLNTETAA